MTTLRENLRRLIPPPSDLFALSKRRDSRLPPGPGQLESFEGVFAYSRDPLGHMLEQHEKWGDCVDMSVGPYHAFMFCDPEIIEEVLLRQREHFVKDKGTRDLRLLLGRGLLTNEGESWRRQRKLVAPNLQRRHVARYADLMVEGAARHIEDYRDDEVVDVHRRMMRLTLEIVVEALFDTTVEGDVDVVGEAMEVAMDYFQLRVQTWWHFMPRSVPIPGQKALERARARLDEIIYELIDRRVASGHRGDDLLSRLIEAYEDSEVELSREQLRDEVITMFMAGHETTALALSYTWWLLGHDSRARRRVRQEVERVAEERGAIDFGAMAELRFTKAVIEESMRLYPPAWIVAREAIDDVELGDWTIPRGSQIWMPQWVVHRMERFYDDPETFRPERWLDEEFVEGLPRFAYFPFGGGARICIGNHFAMMEAVLILATMIRRVSFDPIPGQTIEFSPSVTLRPADGVWMRTRLH